MEQREFGASLNLQTFPQVKYKSRWVPLAGRKRKAPDEPSNYDDSEPAPKLSAVDEAVAPFVLKDGYVIDDSDNSNDGHTEREKLVQLENVEMEEEDDADAVDDFFAGEKTSFESNKVSIGDGDFEHALDGMGLPTKLSKGNVQIGSVVLSEEVRDWLAKKQKDVSRLIPPSIVDQKYKNATAVVLWKPPTKPLSLITESIERPLEPDLKNIDDYQKEEEDDVIFDDPTDTIDLEETTTDMEVETLP